MALVATATKISVHATKKPSGYTDPGGVNLSNPEPFYEDLAIVVPKATVANATKSTTFNNIRTDVAVGIEKQVSDKLTAELITTGTVTYNIDWKDIRNNQIFPEEFYSNVAESYICLVDVYVNIS